MNASKPSTEYAPRTPVGRVSLAWFGEGYQAALADIADQLASGGEAAVRLWLENNRRTTEGEPR